ncbi:sugar kinase [Vibrio sp. ZSDZ34]|uniref:2-dehydro-3-deoxygluconokinase n=1 Tax=Vibrio gelatinilyticus TaxID=2893468 RepID=A0A9X1WAW0_9VIBR|nr:sugar kinase [Vibrio gelatinilyticus]MCJ2376951.1 sugar kinase [Vibrio gelatinilyticus]
MKTIAIIGECMIELNGKPFGAMQQTYGGDTLNAAVYLSRSCETAAIEHPIKVCYVSALGSDPLSNGLKAHWNEEGVNTDLVLIDDKRTPGLYLIQLDEVGERTFLYWRDQSAAKYLLEHPDFKKIESRLYSAQMVFISGISLAILPDDDRNKLVALLHKLRAKGVEIAFDSNYRPALWPDDQLSTVKNIYSATYETTDLALVTFDDEHLIWGDRTPQATIERLHQSGVKKVVVKLGAQGCLTSESSSVDPILVSTQPVKNVVDTTSAGDSFNGGFLSAYLAGKSIKRSCHRGNALAGKVIQHPGAIIQRAHTNEITKTFK